MSETKFEKDMFEVAKGRRRDGEKYKEQPSKIQRWNLRELGEAEDKVNKVNISHSNWLTKPFTFRFCHPESAGYPPPRKRD